jgi:hypothetical protein
MTDPIIKLARMTDDERRRLLRDLVDTMTADEILRWLVGYSNDAHRGRKS